MKVKIAAAQIAITPFDLSANLEKIKAAFMHASKKRCNFLCLPEECWAGVEYQEKRTNEVADFMKNHTARLTKQYGIYCIAGTVIEEIKERDTKHLHNVSYIFNPTGTIIGRYAKRHLVPSTEKERIPGESHQIIDTEFGRIGVQICRDILYPEATQITANLGAKIIFSPAFWGKFSTTYPTSLSFHHIDELQMIKYLVPARALENEVFFVFCNAAE
ncbi:MAG: carbon-nitrogen hydrolase family protein [Candidatus Levyibacteriota bacterium]